MAATTKITSLPQEILQDILLLIPVLNDLGQVVQCHSRLYFAFQDRRSFILTKVFRREIFDVGMRMGNPRQGAYWATSSLAHANMMMKSLKKKMKKTNVYSDIDIVTLREALWPYYSPLLTSPSTNTNEWVQARTWAYGLIRSLASIPSKSSIAISHGREIWSILIRRGVALAQEDRDMAQTLIRLYRQESRPDDAFSFQEAVLDRLDPDSNEGFLWAIKLFEDYRSAGRTADELALQMRLWETAQAARGAVSALKWARQVVRTYRELRQPAAAMEFQARIFALLEPRSMEYVAWGRGLIGMLKRAQNRADEILVVRAEVWRGYSPSMDGYHTWAAQMCRELRAKGREEEAIRVEERLWIESCSLRGGSCGASTNVHVRAAAASLARAYRRRRRVAAAEQVEAQLSMGRLRF